MKHISIVVVAALLYAPVGRAQSANAVEQELIKVENGWSDAVVKRDGPALQRLYADEYLYTDSDGVVRSKSQDIADITSGRAKIASFALDDLKVHVYGETAVVTGRNTLKGHSKAKTSAACIDSRTCL